MPLSAKRKRKDDEHVRHKVNGSQLATDLFVSLPKKTTGGNVPIPSKLVLSQVLRRLADTGYGTVAVTHTIYGGRPRDPEDRASSVMKQYKDQLVLLPSRQQPPLRILHRLHLVVESLSDVALLNKPTTPNSLQQQLLNEYDLVSISPRNELVFSAACTCHGVDIVTLEGVAAASHNRLPFRLRATDLAALASRGAVLEIPYATSVLHVAARKGMVQMGRELSTILATRGSGAVPPLHVLCSSASRLVENMDVGPMALRTPGDLINLLRVVLGLDSRTASKALCGVSANAALAHAKRRRQGQEAMSPSTIRVVEVTLNPQQNPSTLPGKQTSNEGQTLMETITEGVQPNDANKANHDDDSRGDQVEDGFISF
jgi:RNase P/RNase MRP subunit p30